MTAEDFVRSAALVVVACHSLNIYLHYRQRRHLRRHDVLTSEAEAVMDKRRFRMTRLYALEKNKFLLMKVAFTLLRDLIVTTFPIYHFVWTNTRHLVEASELEDRFNFVHNCVFGSTIALGNSLFHFPLEIYSTLYIETKYGLNQETPDIFLKHQLTTLIRSQLLICAAVAGFSLVSGILGNNAFLFIWIFISVSSVLFILLYPNCIAPMFDDFTSLPEGSLREKIECLARKLRFPLSGVLIAEGTKRMTHGDVYLLGLSVNKSVVLDKDFYDAVKTSPTYQRRQRSRNDELSGYTEEQVLALLCHEFGHWKSHHNTTHLILSQFHLFIAFVTFVVFLEDKNLYRAFGFGNEQPLLIGILIVAGSLYHPIDEFLDKASVLIARRFEFQADSFAKRHNFGSELKKAVMIQERFTWKFPIEDWMFSCAYNTIPLPLERFRALGSTDDVKGTKPSIRDGS
ncbi:CAAX prenyl protease 1 homolog [Galendromus occidentalis]|uniref:CAAX prenyl protease n=1 Tax=Galendromus occidentalis TaxID=34638 RepID=A0AAJ6QSF3_9ACAR|nr:CAAX prenyl protease 1 homolog [Galendromus occidentalis]